MTFAYDKCNCFGFSIINFLVVVMFRNRCLIELFCGVVCVVTCPFDISVGVYVYVIPTDWPKSVPNRCVIESSGCVLCCQFAFWSLLFVYGLLSSDWFRSLYFSLDVNIFCELYLTYYCTSSVLSFALWKITVDLIWKIEDTSKAELILVPCDSSIFTFCYACESDVTPFLIEVDVQLLPNIWSNFA